jgi:hypothetical protein
MGVGSIDVIATADREGHVWITIESLNPEAETWGYVLTPEEAEYLRDELEGALHALRVT